MAKVKKAKKPPVNIFDEYAENRITLQDAFNRSATWYRSRIKELQEITPDKIMRHRSAFRDRPVKGEVYCFVYDPKHKDTLPYYDTFPLVLPLSVDKDSFLGLNFHYISPKFRFFLLDAIKKNGRGIHKLNISWQIIASFAGTKSAQHCLKRYLFSHMRTPLRKIRAEDVPTALLLPIEKFHKSTKQNVWRRF